MARVVVVDVVYQKLRLRLTRVDGVRPEGAGAGATPLTVDARSLSRADRLHSGSYDPCTCRHLPTVVSLARDLAGEHGGEPYAKRPSNHTHSIAAIGASTHRV